MFCKFCGGKIDRQIMACADCGKAVGSLEGGVGFWDLAGKGETGSLVVNNENKERNNDVILEKLEYLETKKPPVPVITMILLGICLLVNLAFIGIVLNLNKTVEYLRTDIQIMKAEDNREDVLSETGPVILETEPEDTETTSIELEEFPIQITKQPTGDVLH